MSVVGAAAGRTILGWREWLALPDLGILRIKAKLDTGARSSALHVDVIEEFARADGDWLRFQIEPLRRLPRSSPRRWIQARLHDRREVRDSAGVVSLRPFILTSVLIGERCLPIEINLTSRRGMLFPMLLGRTAMAGCIVVDPARSFVLGDRRPKPARKMP
ncbi:MAG: ATP-dependent zinc protease [Lysobacterales bacterium CG02_land_8_20_14_3_00_62_12]|nr:MAG: ATP-dependent zinc protease [Xanthomonadales bacterium CG02_land_8_20_14_3_00_62_12]